MRHAIAHALNGIVPAWHRLAEAERGRFVPWLAVAMAGGAAWFFAGTTDPDPRRLAGMVLSGLVLVSLGRRWPPVMAIGMLAVAFGLGAVGAQWATSRAAALEELPTRATVVEGRVGLVEVLPQARRVTIEAPSLDGGAALGRAVRVRLRAGDGGEVAPGDTVRVRALFLRPGGAAWPGGWDIQFDAFFAGLAGYGYALGPVAVVREGAPEGLWARLRAVQQGIIARVHETLPGPEGRIAAGLMVGGAAAIPEAERAAWRDSGIYHLLSISGLHLGIAMGLVFAVVRGGLAAWEWAALRLPVKAIAAVAALLGGGAYTLLTGAQVPMLRSFAMACLVTLAILAGRRALSLRAWALAMAGVVALAPQAVVGVSFQMSFAAVLALIAGFEAMRPALVRLRGEGGWGRKAAAYGAGVMLASALAGTAAAPFGAYHFGQVQIYYVLANLVAVPVTAVLVMPAAVVALLLMPLGLDGPALAAMGWGVELLGGIAHGVAGWPQASVAVPHIAPWGLVAFSLGLAWLGLWRSRLRLAGLGAMALGLASAVLVRPPDVLVSSDARLIGLRAGGVLHVLKSQGGNAYVLDAWRAMLAAREVAMLPGDVPGVIACGAEACRFRPREGAVAAVVALRPPGEDAAPDWACAAGLVVSAEPLRLGCRVAVIDRFSVWRQGATAAWLEPGGVRMVTDRAVRGTRPWVVPLPTRGRLPPGPALPMARPEGASGERDAEE
jgi:competence protein ComEC